MEEEFETVDEYIASERKKPSFWMVFHTIYNDVHGFGKEVTEHERANYINPAFVDNDARNEFLSFMKNNFVDIKLVKVLDSMSTDFLELPYLGSILVDADIDSDVYKALCEKYGAPDYEPNSSSAVLWYMDEVEAMQNWKKREYALNDL